jgi:hypothetical protein
MPTLITHAKPPPSMKTLSALALPNLKALLPLLTPVQRQTREEDSLSPLHELLRAQALGLQAQDGLLPWAALQAHSLQLPAAKPGAGWAWLTPCHWQVNTDHVRMANPADCEISAEESTIVMKSLRAFLAEDGITLHGQQADGNWLALGAAFHSLPTASLARASGGTVDHWMPRQAQAQPLRRLQNEMQMLLYAHPVNDSRAARRLLPINSFWISGTGDLPDGFTSTNNAGATVMDALQNASLNNDGPAWAQTLQALDASAVKTLLEQARRGEPVELTLCGEIAAQTFTLQPQGLWTRLSNRFASADIPALLQSL